MHIFHKGFSGLMEGFVRIRIGQGPMGLQGPMLHQGPMGIQKSILNSGTQRASGGPLGFRGHYTLLLDLPSESEWENLVHFI